MSHHEFIDLIAAKNAVQVKVATIEIPIEAVASVADADGLRRAVTQWTVGELVAVAPPERPRPVRATLRRWSPFRPFVGLLANYGLAREALGRTGKVSILYICIAAGLASVVWRHASIPIGIAGGLVVSGILFVRTGAYREYLAALEEAHGVPPLDVVLRHNVDHLLRRIRTLWRR